MFLLVLVVFLSVYRLFLIVLVVLLSVYGLCFFLVLVVLLSVYGLCFFLYLRCYCLCIACVCSSTCGVIVCVWPVFLLVLVVLLCMACVCSDVFVSPRLDSIYLVFFPLFDVIDYACLPSALMLMVSWRCCLCSSTYCVL